MNFYFKEILLFLKKYYLVLVVIFLTIILAGNILFSIYLFQEINKEDYEYVAVNEEIVEEKNEESIINKFQVDIKGCVKKPGVYEVLETQNVNDAIKMAGGLKNNCDTKMINLSKKLQSEMVIYVPTKVESSSNSNSLTKTDPPQQNSLKEDINNSLNDALIDNDNSVGIDNSNKEETPLIEKNNKVNINTALKEELMTLSGIGASKAEAIIKYREEQGTFKSIEDIKNVSGIGDAAFEKIKESITV